MFTPTYELNNRILELVAEISENAALSGLDSEHHEDLRLRKINRIRSVHGSIAIEQNSLTLDQVTAVINGRRVLAPQKEISEALNAYKAYEHIPAYAPYDVESMLEAHGILMNGLTYVCGKFRDCAVGIVNGKGELLHTGPDYREVPKLVEELLAWTEKTEAHMLIKSCIFHARLEIIHPFTDGNGRIGRLWHTLLLSRWKKGFEWLPIESAIHDRQEEYYAALGMVQTSGDYTLFIEFILDTISKELKKLVNPQVNHQVNPQDVIAAFCKEPRSKREIAEHFGYKDAKHFGEAYLKPLMEAGRIEFTIPDKPNSRNQKYISK